MNILRSSSIKTGRRKLIGFVVALLMSFAFSAAIMPQAAQAAEAQSGYGGHYHWVAKGDSLSKIARRYSVTVYQLASANGLGTTDYLYVGQKIYVPAATGSPYGCKWHYYVKHGDTLSHIAKYYGVNYAALASANGLSSAEHIYVGQKICIPEIYGSGGHYNSGTHHNTSSHYAYHNGYHTVKHGETLANIAHHYGVSVYQLAHANHISNVDHIYVGQHISISW